MQGPAEREAYGDFVKMSAPEFPLTLFLQITENNLRPMSLTSRVLTLQSTFISLQDKVISSQWEFVKNEEIPERRHNENPIRFTTVALTTLSQSHDNEEELAAPFTTIICYLHTGCYLLMFTYYTRSSFIFLLFTVYCKEIAFQVISGNVLVTEGKNPYAWLKNTRGDLQLLGMKGYYWQHVTGTAENQCKTKN